MLFDDKSKSIAQAYLRMLEEAKKKEGPKMDPVGKEDGDVDNDGDMDSSDSYLKNRRKAISKSVEEASSCGMKSSKKEEVEITIGGKSKASKNGMKKDDGGDEEEDDDMDDDEYEDEDEDEVEVKKAKRPSMEKEGYKSDAQRKAVWASRNERGMKEEVEEATAWKKRGMDPDKLPSGVDSLYGRETMKRSVDTISKTDPTKSKQFSTKKLMKMFPLKNEEVELDEGDVIPFPGKKKEIASPGVGYKPRGLKTGWMLDDPVLAAKLKQAKQRIKAKKAYDANRKQTDNEMKEAAKNAYAIGMATAMKSSGDEPPLEKSTITKAHKIAKSIMKKESTVWNWDHILEASDEELDSLIEQLNDEDFDSFAHEFYEFTEMYAKAKQGVSKEGQEKLEPRAPAEKAFVNMHRRTVYDDPEGIVDGIRKTTRPIDRPGVKAQSPIRPGDKRSSEQMKTVKSK